MEEYTYYKGIKITRETILKELADFDAQYKNTNDYDAWLNKDTYKYALIYSGRKYPHKYILSRVSGVNTSEMLGGLPVAEIFTKLGFTVEEKNKKSLKNTWIFQGNPKVYDVDGYLKDNREIQWSLRQEYFKDKIFIGDIAYIWRSDGLISGSGGIVAKSKIISLPHTNRKDDSKYQKEGMEHSGLVIDLEVTDYRLTEKEGMLQRIDLEKDDKINNMQILKTRSGTNFELKPEEAEYLCLLWEGSRQYLWEKNRQVKSETKMLLLKKRQIILYGPPGTGKTFNTKKIALELLSKE
jgi:SpoVK/Ycf46/Vps4 family AAA+-type ATPase